MPKTVEMIVSLKVLDNTAITALQTLQKIGFSKIKDISRAEYYKFSIEGDVDRFKAKISKVDLIANANKHSCNFSIPKNSSIKILIKNIDDDGSDLLATLKNRLGFKNIKKVDRAILWSLAIEADEKESGKIAENAAKELLANEHYQEYSIF